MYLHLVDFYDFHVGTYTSPMDPMGNIVAGISYWMKIDMIHFPTSGSWSQGRNLEFVFLKTTSYLQTHCFKIFQEISNRTQDEQTPKSEYLTALATRLGVRW